MVALYLGPNRRTRPSQSWFNKCRLCWASLDFDSDQVEITEQYTYYRCPECGGSFPMRRDDIEVFG